MRLAACNDGLVCGEGDIFGATFLEDTPGPKPVSVVTGVNPSAVIAVDGSNAAKLTGIDKDDPRVIGVE